MACRIRYPVDVIAIAIVKNGVGARKGEGLRKRQVHKEEEATSIPLHHQRRSISRP